MARANPFIYGEIVPPEAFLDRELEQTQLARDLLDAQKVSLVAPRRYGKSSLIAIVLRDLEARGVRAFSLTVTQYATYRAFLEASASTCCAKRGDAAARRIAATQLPSTG